MNGKVLAIGCMAVMSLLAQVGARSEGIPGTSASASTAGQAPKDFECFSIDDEDPLAPMQRYHILFNESASTVSVDGDPPVKATVTDQQIEWVSQSIRWRIDRVSGNWSGTEVGGVNDGWVSGGHCTLAQSD